MKLDGLWIGPEFNSREMFSWNIQYKLKIISYLEYFCQIKGWNWDYYVIPGYIDDYSNHTDDSLPKLKYSYSQRLWLINASI